MALTVPSSGVARMLSVDGTPRGDDPQLKNFSVEGLSVEREWLSGAVCGRGDVKPHATLDFGFRS